MPEAERNQSSGDNSPEMESVNSSTPAKGGQTTTEVRPAKPPVRQLPPWKVLLHNDDENDMDHVVDSITMLTPLNKQDAVLRMIEAHQKGLALLLTTHKERAELYQQQFNSRNLTVTIEPA